MDHAIVSLSLVSLMSEPSYQSRMFNQLLFGELLTIEQRRGRWIYVQNSYDGHKGWCDLQQVSLLDEHEYVALKEATCFYTKDLITPIYHLNSKTELYLPFGSHLCDIQSGKLTYSSNQYIVNQNLFSLKIESKRSNVVANAMKFLKVPFMSGGRSSFGIDSSGLVQQVFKVCGIALQRFCDQQAKQGHRVDFIEDALPGDLAFFENDEEHIIHVGIVLDNQRIIHSSGYVRIDRLDHHGIFNEEIGRYSHKLRFVKDFFN